VERATVYVLEKVAILESIDTLVVVEPVAVGGGAFCDLVAANMLLHLKPVALLLLPFLKFNDVGALFSTFLVLRPKILTALLTDEALHCVLRALLADSSLKQLFYAIVLKGEFSWRPLALQTSPVPGPLTEFGAVNRALRLLTLKTYLLYELVSLAIFPTFVVLLFGRVQINLVIQVCELGRLDRLLYVSLQIIDSKVF
jgi:hypothetical protein